jgi:hypothetical protein
MFRWLYGDNPNNLRAGTIPKNTDRATSHGKDIRKRDFCQLEFRRKFA